MGYQRRKVLTTCICSFFSFFISYSEQSISNVQLKREERSQEIAKSSRNFRLITFGSQSLDSHHGIADETTRYGERRGKNLQWRDRIVGPSADSISAERKRKTFGGDFSVRGQDGQERGEDQRPKRSPKGEHLRLRRTSQVPIFIENSRVDAQLLTEDHLQ